MTAYVDARPLRQAEGLADEQGTLTQTLELPLKGVGLIKFFS